MSLKAMGWVWERSPNKDGTLVLELALADQCNDQGECWPSVTYLAKKCRMTDRQVQRCVKKLKEQGILTVSYNSGKGGKGTNLYKLTYKGVTRQIVTPDKLSPVTPVSPPTNCHPRHLEQEGVTLETEKGDVDVTRTVREPSVEPSIPPNPQGGKVGKRKKSVAFGLDQTCTLFGEKAPELWDSPEFRSAVENFHGHRSDKGSPWTERSILTAISDFQTWGVEKSIRSMKDSISGGWTGLFEPRSNGKSKMASAAPPADPYEKYKNGF